MSRGGADLVGAVRGVLLVAVLLVAAPALSQVPPPDHAQLDYTRADPACPEESLFRDYVAARFGGQDPFVRAAPRRISLALSREAHGFVAKLHVFDQAGKEVGAPTKPLVNRDCTKLVEQTGGLVVAWLEPLTVPMPGRELPRAEPAPARPPAEPKPALEPPKADAVQRAEPASSAPPAPAPTARKPGVFDGNAGLARAALFGLSAGGVAMGSAFVLGADNKGNGARQVGQRLQAEAGPSACMNPRSGGCQEVAQLAQQHDTLRQFAIGSFVVGGVLGTAATASIWLVRTPAAPSVQVQTSAGSSGAVLTLQGSW